MQTLPFPSSFDVMTSAPPPALGPYVILEELGRGGCGIVYRARAPRGEIVAVKTLRRCNEHGGLAAEIHALRRIQHPGVVRVFDDGVDRGRPWFSMEWLEGETLGAYADRHAETRRERGASTWSIAELQSVLRLVSAICEPLRALHEAGIVHRDLKPDNIFLRGGRTPVLMDFGLASARAPDDHRAVAEASELVGTLGYMAPEQLTGELVDARTDLYALGCILFELLVGAPRVAFDDCIIPSQLASVIPERLAALVKALLAPRARDRLGHAEDVIAWLEPLLDERSPSPPRTRAANPWLYRPLLSGRREVIARLSQGLDRLRRGRGSFMVLEGESGIGKTHLASEIGRLAAGEATTVLTAASAHNDGSPQPLACWERLFTLAVERTLARPELPVAVAVARHVRLLVRLHAGFARLGPVEPTPTLPTPPEVFAAILDLIAALTEERPLVILLDDLQWVDELSLGVIQLLGGDWLVGRRLFVLATFRDDERVDTLRGFALDGAVERIPLGPLPEADLRELVADMLGVSEPPSAVVEWIARRAEGNPFLAAEYLRLVVSELPMDRELALPVVRVRPPAEGALESLPTPGSVHDLVGRRLRLLGRLSRDIAELLAVLGGSASAATVQALAPDVAALDALVELERRQLVEATPDGGRRLLHDRLRAVLYEALAPARRSELHGRAAQLLEAGAKGLPHAIIARHHGLAGNDEQALLHLELAGEAALSRAAYEAAARHFDDLRATASRLERKGARYLTLRRSRWHLGAARAEYGRGDLDACEGHVRGALALVGRRLPRHPVAWAAMALREGMVNGASVLGRTRPSEQTGSALHGEVALAASLLPYRYFYDEDLLPVIGTALLSANLARRGPRGGTGAAGPKSLLAMMAGVFRLPRVAARYFEDAHRGAAAQEDHREVAQVLSLESMDHGNFARWEEAERAARAAAVACAQTTDPWLLETVETSVAHVEYFTGRFEAARARAEAIERIARERRNVQHAVWGLYLQARSDLALERWTSARGLLDEALRHLAVRPEMISEVACHGMLAHALFEEGDAAGAEERATWVVDSVRKRVPPAYPSIVGYSGAAHVLRALVERAPTTARRRAAQSIGLSLWRFASLFPVAYPAACLHSAHLLRLGGRPRLANPMFARGARWAEEHRMPWEAALLRAGARATS